jgi:DegV family protein with EDD domain
MSKICIITDSSVALFPEEAYKLGIEIAPLSVIIKGKEYKDLLDISPNQIIETLRAGEEITTSQPNLGFLDNMMERIKKEKYDHILVFSIAGYLSGTFQAFRLAANNHNVPNVTFLDSCTAAGPIRHVAIEARKMADAGASVEAILAYAEKVFKDTVTYILPENLDQLRKGGRVKGTVATLSNLLKIKLCLYLDHTVTTIEKFDTNRTEIKLFNAIYEDMKKRGFSAQTHKVYLPQCDANERVTGFKNFLLGKEPDTDTEIIILPAGISAHVGLGAYGIQTALKA